MLKGVDQDKIRQEMGKEALAVDRVEPAEEGQVFYFDPSYVFEKEVHLLNKDLFYKDGTRVNPWNFFNRCMEDEKIQWLKEQLSYA